MNGDKMKKKKGSPCSLAIVIILLLYSGVSMYFLNHFYFGTNLNGINVSGDTIEETKIELKKQNDTYSITLNGRNNVNDIIYGKDIDFKYDINNELDEIKTIQPAFGWIFMFFQDNNFNVDNLIRYDEAKLKEHVQTLEFFNDGNIIEPKDATVEYVNNSYSIVKEEKGCKVDSNSFIVKLNDAIKIGKLEFNLDEEQCYVNPKVDENSENLKTALTELNTYIKSDITYTVLDKEYKVNSDKISTWLSLDEEQNVVIDEEGINLFIKEIASNYGFVNGVREFKTSLGTVAEVYGGDYGNNINTSDEQQYLVSAIKLGKVETREPEFAQLAMSSNSYLGNTYVEINLTKQYLWAYSNGELIAEGNIVTGNLDGKHNTPQGVYKLKYKQKNAILRGPGYESPVSFWMPFNGDIGMHDATWRSSFGGEIYKYDGSHGCVNCPYGLAEKIFNNIPAGAPIVCYF